MSRSRFTSAFFPVIEDPRSEIYLKICYVCQEPAKPGTEHLRNYGGIVCYSCRAFWRRSHQKTKNPNFFCKRGGRCPVTVSTRRRCKKCRYERCLKAGMIPEAVLDEGQKKIRFRKLHQRQRMQEQQQQGQATSSSRSGEHEDDDDQDDDVDNENDDVDDPDEVEIVEPTERPVATVSQPCGSAPRDHLVVTSSSAQINHPATAINHPSMPSSSTSRDRPVGTSSCAPINHPVTAVSRAPINHPSMPTCSDSRDYPIMSHCSDLRDHSMLASSCAPRNRPIPPSSSAPINHPVTTVSRAPIKHPMMPTCSDPRDGRMLTNSSAPRDYLPMLERISTRYAMPPPNMPKLIIIPRLEPEFPLLHPYPVPLIRPDERLLDYPPSCFNRPNAPNPFHPQFLPFYTPAPEIRPPWPVDTASFNVPTSPCRVNKRSSSSEGIPVSPPKRFQTAAERKCHPAETKSNQQAPTQPEPKLAVPRAVPRESKKEPSAASGSNILKTAVNSLSRCLKMSQSQTRDSAIDQLLAKLDEVRKGDTSIEISRREVFLFISKLSGEFRHFALLQRSFLMLSRPDQRQLLIRNTPLYVQLHIGSFLVDKDEDNNDGNSSASGNFPVKKFWMKNFLQNVLLERFNNITKLFRPGADLDVYGRLVNKLKLLPSITTCDQKSVLASAILFQSDDLTLSPDGSDLLDEVQEINALMYEHHIRRSCDNCPSFESLSKALVKMALFCAYQIDWNGYAEMQLSSATDCEAEVQKSIFASNHVISYTIEEELWLNKQVRTVNETIRSVSFDDKFVKQYFLHAKGEPLPDDHMPGFFKTTLARLWRITMIHPEFMDLSVKRRSEQMDANAPLALALMVVKAENCANAVDQLQEGFGEFDEVIWRSDFLPFFDNTDEIKKNSIRDTNQFYPEEEVEFFGLVESGKVLVDDPVLYKLNLLYVLTRPSTSTSAMAGIHKNYEMMIRRRIEWMTKMENSVVGTEEAIRNIFVNLASLPRVSDIAQAVNMRLLTAIS